MDAYNQYRLLRAQGVPATQAIQIAFPDGLPTQQTAEEQAEDAQSNQLAATGGTIAGLLGTRYIYDQLGKTAAEEGAKQIGTQVAQSAAENAAYNASANAAANAGVSNAGTTAATAAAPNSTLASLGGIGPLAGLLGMSYAAHKNFESDGGYDFLQGKIKKQNAIDAGMNSNPVSGWINPTIKFFGGDSVGTMLGGKTTDQYRAERINDLKDSSPGWYDYQAKRWEAENNQDTLANPSAGWGAGEEWNWDKALDLAKNDGKHFIGVQGNAETFGDDFLRLEEAKQAEIAQRLANEGLYHSNKGNVLISDDNQDKARSIYNEIAGNAQPSQLAATLSGQDFNKPNTSGLDMGQAQKLTPNITKPGRLPGFENMSDEEYQRIFGGMNLR